MITVSKLAQKFGLSRTTLLYYDSIGLLSPRKRSSTGYRLYSEQDIERLHMICSYRNAGMKLAEIGQLLKRPEAPDVTIFKNRLIELDNEIGKLRSQQQEIIGILQSLGGTSPINTIDKKEWINILRSCGLTEEDMDQWHARFEKNAPDAHHAFLLWLGISHDEALEIRSNSRK